MDLLGDSGFGGLAGVQFSPPTKAEQPDGLGGTMSDKNPDQGSRLDNVR